MLSRLVFILSLLLASLAPAQEKKPAKDHRPFSKTVPEAAAWVLATVPEKTTLQVAPMHPEGLIHLHFSLGLWIRNNVPVWGNTPLLLSVGGKRHPDDVGGMILKQYWRLARARLPEPERLRIEYFEQTLPTLRGRQPAATTHHAVLAELSAQIRAAWPQEAPFPPFSLEADPATFFNWKPHEMTDDLPKNVERFLRYHRSVPFYAGDALRVGTPPP